MRLFVASLALVVVGCSGQPKHEDVATVVARLTEQGHAVDTTLAAGSIRYLGFTNDPLVAKPGDNVTVTEGTNGDGFYEAVVSALMER